MYVIVITYRHGREGGAALSLLVNISQHQPSIGYFLLMYLLYRALYTPLYTHIHFSVIAHKLKYGMYSCRDQLPQYRDFATQSVTEGTLHSSLISDLKVHELVNKIIFSVNIHIMYCTHCLLCAIH